MGFNYDTWGGSWGTSWGNAWGLQGAVAPDAPGKRRRGAPNRKIYWWEQDRFYLPPHKKVEKPEEPLPHEAAIEDAKAELAKVRRAKAAGTKELLSLQGRLGALTAKARRVERQIEAAQDITVVAEQYRTLGQQLTSYMDALEVIRAQRRKREAKDEEKIMMLILELDI